MAKEKKTVIVFGAGFSIGSLIPKQDDLLKTMESFYSATACTSVAKANWLNFVIFFRKYLGKNIDEYLIEDIFTILDKCQIDSEYYKGANGDQIRKAYFDLLQSLRMYLINIVDDSISKQKGKYRDYSRLANGLLSKRKGFGKKDKIALISLNWDSYFERTINAKLTNYRKDKLGLDYCTYDYSFDNGGKSLPSTWKKASGRVNLKYLKPHGSINWGYCPNCGRIYISYGTKIVKKFECIKFCNKKYKSVGLAPVMITPTFLKDISNEHLKEIWSNVGIELSEATDVIFIGYSLRPEDYYFRYMLSKYIDKGTSIYVYDYVDPGIDAAERTKRKNEIEHKFKRFLQNCKVSNVNIDGWGSAIDEILAII